MMLCLSLLLASNPQVTQMIGESLPADLVVESVVMRRELPAGVERIEWRSPPRPGTMSVLVIGRDRSKAWASIKLAAAARSSIDLSQPPIARGSELTVIAVFGTAKVSAAAVLERSARIGELATARLKNSPRLVRGHLVNARTLVIEGDNR